MHDEHPEHPLTTARALELGYSPSQLRSATWPAPFRGVRVGTQPASQRERIAAYAPLLRHGHVFSHVSAAVLWDLWLPPWCDYAAEVDVTSIAAVRPARMAGVRGHHVNGEKLDVDDVGGLPVTSPLDTYRSLSTRFSINELIAAGDSLVRRSNPLLTMAELERVIGRHAGRRGNKALRAALPLVRPRCDSARETRVRIILVEGGLPEPVVNHVVSRTGERLRYGDLVYPRWKIIVEYDGRWHMTPEQVVADIERLEQLTRAGWTIIRVVNEHLDDPVAIVRRVADALRTAGWRP